MEENTIVLKSKILPHIRNYSWKIVNASKSSHLACSERFSLLPGCKIQFQSVAKVTECVENNFTLKVGFKRVDRCNGNIRVITFLRMCDSNDKIYTRRHSAFSMSSKNRKIYWCISSKFSNSQNSSEKLGLADCQETFSGDSEVHSSSAKKSENNSSKDDEVPSLLNDVLVVKGIIKIYNCCIASESDVKKTVIELTEAGMAKQSAQETVRDLKFAYDSNLFTDISLRVGWFEVHAHKFVLCGRCPYLKKIIIDGKNIDSISIVDMNKLVLESFLRFLYTGTVGTKQWDIIRDLFAIADKYEMPSLKKNCSAIIRSLVEESNACCILILANEHKDDDLKTFVMSFIANHFSEVDIHENFSTIIRSHPELAAEVINIKNSKCLS